MLSKSIEKYKNMFLGLFLGQSLNSSNSGTACDKILKYIFYV